MTSALNMLRACATLTDWLRAQGLEPPPSEVAETILDVLGGATPSGSQAEVWRRIAPSPPPSRLPTAAVLQEGRGSFKSTILIDLAAHRLLGFDAAPYVAPGSEVVAIIVSPAKKQAAGTVRNARARCERIATAHGGKLHVRELSNDGAEFVFDVPNLGYVPVLRVGAADEATLRGAAYVFCGLDEAGWFPSDERHKNTASDIHTAVAPRLPQFPHGLFVLASTNGPPKGLFFDWCTKTPASVVKVGPVASWVAAPSMYDEATIRASFTPELVTQEFECLTWGLHDETYLETAACLGCIDDEARWTPRRQLTPRIGIMALDHAPLRDGAASAYLVRHEKFLGDHGIDHAEPVSWFVAEWISQLQGSPTEPITARLHIASLKPILIQLGYPPMVFDPYSASDIGAEANRQLGYREAETPEELGPRRYFVLPMDPAAQTTRWTHLKAIVQGHRLFVPDSVHGRAAMVQASELRATQLASGALRVDGRRDDLIEVIKEAAWFARTRPAVDDGDGVVTYEGGGWGTYEHGTRTLSFDGGYVRTMSDGRRVPIEPPLGSKHVGDYCRDRIYRGELTERTFEWLRSIFGREPTQDDVQRVRDGEFNDR